jgi:uncharacterized cupin superfamily protein
VGFTVIRGDSLEFGHPSWRPEDTVRGIVEVNRRAPLASSRANLWRYPPGASGRRHVQLVQEETFVVLEGRLPMLLAGCSDVVRPDRHPHQRTGGGMSGSGRPDRVLATLHRTH